MALSPRSETNVRMATRRMIVILVAVASVLLVGVASAVIYAGIYNIAADAPHTEGVYWLLKKVRERSVAVRAEDIAVPTNLGNQERIVSGAAQYAEMCSGCHLAPGMRRTEISRGLYPRAPELWRGTELSPAEEFWVVKHGIKMTGMPAWGVTHEDDILWDIVAFLRQLPKLTADEYQSLVKEAPRTHDEMMRDMRKDDGQAGHGSH